MEIVYNQHAGWGWHAALLWKGNRLSCGNAPSREKAQKHALSRYIGQSCHLISIKSCFIDRKIPYQRGPSTPSQRSNHSQDNERTCSFPGKGLQRINDAVDRYMRNCFRLPNCTNPSSSYIIYEVQPIIVTSRWHLFIVLA